MIALGDFQVSRVVEYEGAFMRPEELFVGFEESLLERNRAWLGPVLDPQSGLLLLSFHSFVLRTPQHTILIDSCMGNDKHRPNRPMGHRRNGDFLQRLADAKVHPEEVDFVMCTHLHWDHVGWNTQLVDGRWIPTFPNARYIMAKKEYEHWDRVHASGTPSMHGLAFKDSIQPIVRAERAILVDDGHCVEDGVWVESCPGHTPGNVLINLESNRRRAVFSGDVIHSPLQLAQPDLCSHACHNPAESAAARRQFIEKVADTGTVVMPAHFLAPSAGHILANGDAFKFARV